MKERSNLLYYSVNIYFYLEDDTIHVSEPRVQNSGIPQGKPCKLCENGSLIITGTLIRRHRIPKVESVEGQHFIVSDLNVNHEVTFYGRTFKIVGCDNFTRVFIMYI